MKKIFTFLTVFAAFAVVNSTRAQISNYCTSSASSPFDSRIDQVMLGSISTTAPGVGVNQQYTDNTALSTVLSTGLTYSITVVSGTGGGAFTNYQRAWIDYNQNNVFDDPAERIMDGTGTPPFSTTANFTVPGSALPGTTFMRVISDESFGPLPCDPYTYGETEDYTIIIPAGAPNDAGVASIDAPTSVPCGGGSANVVATIQNFGSNVINVVTVNWSVNGVLQTPVTHSTALNIVTGPPPNTAQLTLGTASITGITDIKVWTSDPNSTADTLNLNDTVEVTVAPPLNGVYTIDPLGVGANNFQSFVDAADLLDLYGVCGPVEFYAKSGTYNGAIVLNTVTGSGPANPIMFMADSTNTAPVVVSSSDPQTWRITSTSDVTIDGLEIENTGANTDALYMNGTLNDITIQNCKISIPLTTSSLYLAFDFDPSNAAQNLIVRNNEFFGGYYVVRIQGANTTTSRINNVVFEDNIADGGYYYGAYIYSADSVSVHNNHFSAVSAFASTFSYGLYLGYMENADISKNFIHGIYRGLYLNQVDGSSKPVMVTNNKIMLGDSTLNLTNGLYAVYSTTSNSVDYIHNTIISQSSAGQIMYFTGTASGNRVLNNILARPVTPSGTGMFLSTPFQVSGGHDYNAYLLDSSSAGGPLQNIAFNLDSNSFYLTEALYDNLSADSLITCNTELPGRGVGTEVTTDWNGNARDASAPTVGPYEYLAPGAPVMGEDFLLCMPRDTVVYNIPLVAGASYLWSNGDTVNTLTVTEPGSYGVVVSGLTCGTGILQDDVVIGNASSTAAYTSERFWKTVSFTNSSTNAIGYMWDFGDGQTSADENPVHLYDVNGMYNACLTTYGDCDTVTTCDSVFAHNAVGVAEFAGNGSIAMYPNPASSLVTIEADGIEGNVLSIEVSNIAGQIVLTSQLNDFNGYVKRDLAVGDLNEGIYFVKLFTSEFTNTQRLVIRR